MGRPKEFRSDLKKLEDNLFVEQLSEAMQFGTAERCALIIRQRINELKKDKRETDLSKLVKDFLKSGEPYFEVKKEDANRVQNYLRVQHGFKKACFRSLPHRPGTAWVFLGDEDFYKDQYEASK